MSSSSSPLKVTQDEVTHEELGGAQVHATKSGVADFAIEGEEECLAEVRRLLSFIPSNNMEDPPLAEPVDDSERRCDDLASIVPEDATKPYDIREVIYSIVDDGDFLEVHASWAGLADRAWEPTWTTRRCLAAAATIAWPSFTVQLAGFST